MLLFCSAFAKLYNLVTVMASIGFGVQLLASVDNVCLSGACFIGVEFKD